MNTISKLTALTLLIALIFSGCEKDPLQPDKNALRISKIADNSIMEDPWYVFTYNSDGLLTMIDGDWGGGTSIAYNDDDLPIKIGDVDVTWTESGFSYSDNGNPTSYELDSKGRIIKITEENVYDNEIRITNMIWNGTESVDVDGHNWSVIRTFNENHNPLASINIAILIVADIEVYPFEYYFQNQYCVATNQEDDDSVVDIEYTFNDNNYPNRLKGSEASYYVYFEYESE
jgi:hypothetical protein